MKYTEKEYNEILKQLYGLPKYYTIKLIAFLLHTKIKPRIIVKNKNYEF